jgi:hypothetical protein
MIDGALARLTLNTHATALKLLALPELIRGDEDIKLRSVAVYRERASELR